MAKSKSFAVPGSTHAFDGFDVKSDRRKVTNKLEEKGQHFAGCVEEEQQQGLSGNRSDVKTSDFTNTNIAL